MYLKKQALSGAYGGFQCCFCSTYYTTSTSPAVLPIPRARPAEEGKRKRQSILSSQARRMYATAKNSASYDFRDNMNWPCQKTPQPSTQPTPYDIFELERGAAYSKHKFYELVKIYHPDRHHSTALDQPIHALSRVERLERYRLVVKAHEILSDPAKRRAYDATGMGWGAGSSSPSSGYAYSRTHASSTEGDSPFANATWEDWERWYSKTSHPNGGQGQAYEGTYFNHNAFASFVIIAAIISGILQATYVGTSAGSVEERARAFTAQTHKFMNDRKVENARYLTNEGRTHGAAPVEPVVPLLGPAADERVRHFLERRDPHRYGLKEEEEEYYRSHFTGKNVSSPASTTNDATDATTKKTMKRTMKTTKTTNKLDDVES